jgi:Fic family protein
MKSFLDLDLTLGSQPRSLGPILSRIDVGKGKEQLFEDQRPEVLLRLAEDARIASIKASNAIEGVVVDVDRAELIADGSQRYRNRNEREFAGYRDAVDLLMREGPEAELTVPFILHLHRLLFRYSDGRGGSLKKDQNVIVSYDGGSREIVFTPVSPDETEFSLSELLARYQSARSALDTHPIVLIGAFVLDFLSIHPVADGNGRLARLLTTHELLRSGYGIARYVSIESRIYESKNTYYKALYDSQREWHDSRHDAWPWISYLGRVLEEAYVDFEREVLGAADSRGGKQERVRDYVLREAPTGFRRRDIERALPGVSVATIRLVLAELREAGEIGAEGSGRAAVWKKISNGDRSA